MKKNEYVVPTVIVGVGVLLLYWLYSNGQLGAAAQQATGTTSPTIIVTGAGAGNPTPSTAFQSGTNNINVVSYVPLFGFIGVGSYLA